MAFLNNRDKTTQGAVLQAFADRLAEMPDLNPELVIVSDQSVPHMFASGGLQLTVSPGDSSFNIGAAHTEAFRDLCGVVVGVYILNRRDRPGRSESRLLKKNSVLYWKRMILAHLALEDPRLGKNSKPWEPTKWVGSDQVPLCRSIPTPTKASSPRDVEGHDSWIGLQIYYQVEFDWDLYDGVYDY